MNHRSLALHRPAVLLSAAVGVCRRRRRTRSSSRTGRRRPARSSSARRLHYAVRRLARPARLAPSGSHGRRCRPLASMVVASSVSPHRSRAWRSQVALGSPRSDRSRPLVPSPLIPNLVTSQTPIEDALRPLRHVIGDGNKLARGDSNSLHA